MQKQHCIYTRCTCFYTWSWKDDLDFSTDRGNESGNCSVGTFKEVALYPSPSDSEIPDRLRELLADRGFSSQMKSRCCHENQPFFICGPFTSLRWCQMYDIITFIHFYFFFCFPLEMWTWFHFCTPQKPVILPRVCRLLFLFTSTIESYNWV